MFNLDQSVAEWRRKLRSAGIKDENVLEELEGHLCDEIANLIKSGKTEAEAFKLAVSRMGKAAPMRAEFKVASRDVFWPVAVGAWLWIAAMLVLAGCLLTKQHGLLLLTHIWTVVAGYTAAFVAGGFAICYTCCRRFNQLTPERRQSLTGSAHLFTCLAAGFVVGAIVLAMFWSREHFGHFLDGSPRETCALWATAWLLAVLAFQQFGRPRENTSMLLFTAGNIVVGLAWFGTSIWADPRSYIVPLMIFVGVHLVFLGMGLAPARAEGSSAA